MSDANFGIRPPPPLLITNDGGAKWKNWIQQYRWYETALDLKNMDVKKQTAIFMSTIGPDAVNIYNSFPLTEEKKTDLETIIVEFEKYFLPKINVRYERYIFNNVVQETGEPFDEFLTNLRIKSKYCDFGALTDDFICDRILFGIKDEQVRAKLLNTEDLNLDKAVQICRSHEQCANQLKVIAHSSVDKIDFYKNNRPVQNSHQSNAEHKKPCRYCGSKHAPRKCPAFYHICVECNKRGHFETVCESNRRKAPITNSPRNKSKKVHTVEDMSSEDNEEDFYVYSLTDHSFNKDWIQEVHFIKSNTNIRMKLDSGAQCNVLPNRIVSKMCYPIDSTETKGLVAFGGSKVPVLGEIRAQCKVRSKTRFIRFLVVEGDHPPILGKDSCVAMDLIKRIDAHVKEEVYTGLGCLENFVYDVDLQPGSLFKIHPARPIPHAIKEDVKKELNNMVKLGVIEPVTEPTPAVSPLVIVRQKGKIRLCLDPTDINKHVLRRHFPLNTIEEILPRLKDAKYFTKLDCNRGFWQIKLSKRTSRILTFSTPWGRYSCLRLPFGLCSAPEVFQQIMTKVLEGIQNVEVAIDDVLIYAKSKEELEKITHEVINKIQAAGLTLNKQKCEFNRTRIRFLGHLLTADGILPDPDKVTAIQQLKTPKDVRQVQRFLGMATYLSKFIPHLAQISAPLRELIKKDVAWCWNNDQDAAFKAIKETLQTPPVLQPFNPAEPVTLSVDASSKAVGAVLLQNNNPIAYAAKSLTLTQQAYPQIEREAFAIRFACKKFHNYIFAQDLTVESDHKPLSTIFNKSIHSAPPRLQRLLFDIVQYKPKVIYKKGVDLKIADVLSRDCSLPPGEEEPDLQINLILPFRTDTKHRVKDQTLMDNTLQLLKNTIISGWPERQQDVSQELQEYFPHRDELSTYGEFLFKGTRVIIPTTLRSYILERIHQGHWGIQSCLRRARDTVYWPRIDEDVRNYIAKCRICQLNQNSPPKEKLILRDIPQRPWEIVASDLFTHAKDDYVILADSYSGYFEIERIDNLSSHSVITVLKKWFATHGIPDYLDTDNGPCFASKEFKNFAADWNFALRTSSPHYAQSNGFIERYVQTAKNMLKKCSEDGTDVALSLLNYRNTPRPDGAGSPVQRLMSRRTKTLLPIAEETLYPEVKRDVSERLAASRELHKQYYDRTAVNRREFSPGDSVVMKHLGSWFEGRVSSKIPEQPRSYKVTMSNGNTYRRNSSFLRRVPERLKTHYCPRTAVSEAPSNHSTPSKSEPAQEETGRSPGLPKEAIRRASTENEANSIPSYTTRYGRQVKPPQRLGY